MSQRMVAQLCSDLAVVIKALEFYADNYIDGGSKARMALEAISHKGTQGGAGPTLIADGQGDGT